MNFQVEAYRVNADQVCIDISEKPAGSWVYTYTGPAPQTLEEKQWVVECAAKDIKKHTGYEMTRQERRGIRASIASAVWNLPKKAPEPEAPPVKVVRDTIPPVVDASKPNAVPSTVTAKVVRDTETGEFAKKDRAKKDPKGTVTETVKKKK